MDFGRGVNPGGLERSRPQILERGVVDFRVFSTELGRIFRLLYNSSKFISEP